MRCYDHTGKTFSGMVVLEKLPNHRGNGQTWYRVRCHCGKLFALRAKYVGKQKSCGCSMYADAAETHRTHGRSKGPEYRVWASMIQRCTNPNVHQWSDYGGRGITVCERWHDFANFLADMGDRPPGTTIDRIDNDRGYEAGNCRWATKAEQASNTRYNRKLTHNGETLHLAEWGRRIGADGDVIALRIRRGWSVADAVTVPVRKMRSRNTKGRFVDEVDHRQPPA